MKPSRGRPRASDDWCDTNVLIYAVDKDSPFHDPCRDRVQQARNDPSPAFLTWNICYEFLGTFALWHDRHL